MKGEKTLLIHRIYSSDLKKLKIIPFINGCFFKVGIATDLICDKIDFVRDAKFKRKELTF